MPAKLDRCVEEVMAQGKTEEQAWAICNASIKDESGTYVSMKVKNADHLYEWYKDQGVDVIPAEELHCTIAYSRKTFVHKVDNSEVEIKYDEEIYPYLEPLGDEGAVVMKFKSKAMQERFDKCIKEGATYDYDEYIPHITISYNGKGLNLKEIERPDFYITLHNETVEPLNLNWKDKFKDEKKMLFADSIKVTFDENGKTLISVRDGVQEYAGIELGLEPFDKTFKIYRSSDTIRQIVSQLTNLPITDGHVELEDIPANKIKGYIDGSELVKYDNKNLASTIAIKNNVKLQDNVIQLLDSKNQLSLGYFAETQEHDEYDFEQVNIIPHHLAIVENGRCGSVCKFKDERKEMDPKDTEKEEKTESTESTGTESTSEKKPDEETKDAEAPVNLQRIAEVVKDLPEAVKLMSLEELTALVPVLETAISTARAATPNGQEATEGTEMKGAQEVEEKVETTDGDEVKTESKDEEKTDFKDSQEFKDAVRTMSDERVSVILKAKKFLDEKYDYENICTTQIMKDALATQSKESFKDEEVGVAFKMLKKNQDYSKFADSICEWDKIKDKEI